MRILLLEDDPETAAALQKGFEREGHSLAVSEDAETALAAVDREEFPLAILDVGVPGGSGLDVLRRIREKESPTAVLMLTAHGSIEDRVRGLDQGADDYLVKPFSFAELAARVRAMARRVSTQKSVIQLGELKVDLLKRIATQGDTRIELTPTEFKLLSCLLEGRGEPADRATLLRVVWGYDFDPGTNIVDVHINRLRRKLEAAGAGEVIRTVRGRGYAAG